jgi:hypothetical protein
LDAHLIVHTTKYETRARWRQSFHEAVPEAIGKAGLGHLVGPFPSVRNDVDLVWLVVYDSEAERKQAEAGLWGQESWHKELSDANGELLERTTVLPLRTAYGSVIDDAPTLTRHLTGPDGPGALEIRRYRVRADRRSEFAHFFATRTLEGQAEAGMDVVAQFEVVPDDNLFIWLRGFPDLACRDLRKAAFYDSSLWWEDLRKDAFSMIEKIEHVHLVIPEGEAVNRPGFAGDSIV